MTLPQLLRISTLLMFVLPGILALYVSLRGSEWFFGSHSNRFLVQQLGSRWARVLYFILGLLLLGAAALIWMDPKGLMNHY